MPGPVHHAHWSEAFTAALVHASQHPGELQPCCPPLVMVEPCGDKGTLHTVRMVVSLPAPAAERLSTTLQRGLGGLVLRAPGCRPVLAHLHDPEDGPLFLFTARLEGDARCPVDLMADWLAEECPDLRVRWLGSLLDHTLAVTERRTAPRPALPLADCAAPPVPLHAGCFVGLAAGGRGHLRGYRLVHPVHGSTCTLSVQRVPNRVRVPASHVQCSNFAHPPPARARPQPEGTGDVAAVPADQPPPKRRQTGAAAADVAAVTAAARAPPADTTAALVPRAGPPPGASTGPVQAAPSPARVRTPAPVALRPAPALAAPPPAPTSVERPAPEPAALRGLRAPTPEQTPPVGTWVHDGTGTVGCVVKLSFPGPYAEVRVAWADGTTGTLKHRALALLRRFPEGWLPPQDTALAVGTTITAHQATLFPGGHVPDFSRKGVRYPPADALRVAHALHPSVAPVPATPSPLHCALPGSPMHTAPPSLIGSADYGADLGSVGGSDYDERMEDRMYGARPASPRHAPVAPMECSGAGPA